MLSRYTALKTTQTAIKKAIHFLKNFAERKQTLLNHIDGLQTAIRTVTSTITPINVEIKKAQDEVIDKTHLITIQFATRAFIQTYLQSYFHICIHIYLPYSYPPISIIPVTNTYAVQQAVLRGGLPHDARGREFDPPRVRQNGEQITELSHSVQIEVTGRQTR